MAHEEFAKGVARTAGGQLANAVLSTPQGQAAVAATATMAVAAAPVVATAAIGGAITVGVVYAVGSFIDWLDS